MKPIHPPLMIVLFTSWSIGADPAVKDAQLSRLQQAQQTEVWQSVPVVTAAEDGIPSDAIRLFDGHDLTAWRSENGEPNWRVEQGILTVNPGAGHLYSKQDFCDVQLHLEWKSPAKIEGKQGQLLGNSGVFFQDRYEVQILDSYQNETYANGQASAVYKQYSPLVNAMKPTEQWQRYDMVFMAPRFDDQGELLTPAYLTVFHNGVLTQNHVRLTGETVYIGQPAYKAHGCAPIRLQDHKDKVSFRSIWVRPL